MRKTVVITGATDGIGKALAILLSRDYNLALCGRNEEKMMQLKQELGNVHVYAECFDITDGAMRHGFCQRVMQEFGAVDVCNNILDLMSRKNQLINLKLIVDSAIHKLSEKDKQILFIKMNYNLSMGEICGILDLKERTAFRRIEHAFLNLADALNCSKYSNRLEKILFNEQWIKDVKQRVKEHRLAYREIGC